MATKPGSTTAKKREFTRAFSDEALEVAAREKWSPVDRQNYLNEMSRAKYDIPEGFVDRFLYQPMIHQYGSPSNYEKGIEDPMPTVKPLGGPRPEAGISAPENIYTSAAKSFVAGAADAATFGFAGSEEQTRWMYGSGGRNPGLDVDLPFFGETDLARVAGNVAGGVLPTAWASRGLTFYRILNGLSHRAVSYLAKNPRTALLVGELAETGATAAGEVISKAVSGEELSMKELATLAFFTQAGRMAFDFKLSADSQKQLQIISRRPEVQAQMQRAMEIDEIEYLEALRNVEDKYKVDTDKLRDTHLKQYLLGGDVPDRPPYPTPPLTPPSRQLPGATYQRSPRHAGRHPVEGGVPAPHIRGDTIEPPARVESTRGQDPRVYSPMTTASQSGNIPLGAARAASEYSSLTSSARKGLPRPQLNEYAHQMGASPSDMGTFQGKVGDLSTGDQFIDVNGETYIVEVLGDGNKVIARRGRDGAMAEFDESGTVESAFTGFNDSRATNRHVEDAIAAATERISGSRIPSDAPVPGYTRTARGTYEQIPDDPVYVVRPPSTVFTVDPKGVTTQTAAAAAMTGVVSKKALAEEAKQRASREAAREAADEITDALTLPDFARLGADRPPPKKPKSGTKKPKSGTEETGVSPDELDELLKNLGK